MKNLIESKKAFIAIGAVILLGAGAVFFVLPLLSGADGIAGALATDSHSASQEKPIGEKSHEPGMMYAMKERVVNLGNASGLHYLKLELVLEFDVPGASGLKGEAYKKAQDEFAKEMASRRPIMDDIVTTVLAGQTVASLSNLEGKEALREELRNRFSQVTGEHKLMNVYFIQFIIQ